MSGFITTDELRKMFEFMKIDVNQQLMRMMVTIFDKNEDGTISIAEFEQVLEKYTVKKQITVEELKANTDIIDEKNQKELVEQYNEYVRPKAVFEDFNFDSESMRAIEKREQEAL
jgi:Ca2+-binding EF-hand superfamily protein